jgi:hypothetical protein
MFYSSATYMQYIQSFIRSRLSTADYALQLIISPNYRSSNSPLHGAFFEPSNYSSHKLGKDPKTENTSSDSSSIAARVHIAAVT